jgi:hypothetical protein
MPAQMRLRIILAILMSAISLYSQQRPPIVFIPTSDAIDLARLIAHDEGYDVTKTSIYFFDLLTSTEGKPFIEGYTAVGFYINGNPRNLIVINNKTGQALDFNTCEVFDYPDLKSFQDGITRSSKAKRKTPQELARDAGCGTPNVLTKPVPVAGNPRPH